MEKFFYNKKVLITGHTGFKGAWLTQMLLGFDAKIVGVSLVPDTTPNLFTILGLEEKVKNYFVDIRDLEAMKKIFQTEKPDIVFHLAAQALVRTSYLDPVGTISTNVVGTANILEAIKDVGCVKSAVIITTDKVYENNELGKPFSENDPLGGYDPYSSSKAAADIITQSYIQSFFNPRDFGVTHTTLVAIARAGNVIGGGDWSEYRLIPDIVRSMYHDDTAIEIRSPYSIRPWQHVLEPLFGYLLLAKGLYKENVHLSGAWNFGPHKDSFVTVSDLIEEVNKNEEQCTYTINPDKSKHEAGVLKLNIDKAINMLEWNPRLTFGGTIDMTIAWYDNYYKEKEDVAGFTQNQINVFLRNI